MKVGIMSMQRICNYGSFLQAYGLKKIIESLGHEVVYVDYKAGRPANYETNKKEYYKSYVRSKVMNIASDMIDILFFANEDQRASLSFQKRYKKEFLPILGIDKKYHYHTSVDTLVIGSDEVFNCLQKNPNVGYSIELFGANNKAKKLISYAASFGNTTLEDLRAADKVDELSKLLSAFSAISVRDDNSVSIVRELSNSSISENLDPVLMYDFSTEEVPNVEDSNYILVYAYRNRLSEEEIGAIQRFAKKENKKIISIGGYQGFCDKYIEATPFEVLGYFKNADYVITDTFHGTIFSVIQKKMFATFVRKGNGKIYGNYEKLMDLLERLNLQDRACFLPEDIEKNIYNNIDYVKVHSIISDEREKTLEYLKRNI